MRSEWYLMAKWYTQFGKWWRAGKIAAINHQTQKRSTLTWDGRKLGQTADPDVFTKDGLKDF